MIKRKNKNLNDKKLPVLPLRDIVIFPNMVVPLFVGREKSAAAVDICVSEGRQILLLAQKDGKVEEPKPEDLYEVGTVANILQVLRLPDNTAKILVEGIRRASVKEFLTIENLIWAEIENIANKDLKENTENLALHRLAVSRFEDFIKLHGKIPVEIISALNSVTATGNIADTITAHLPLNIADKQRILATEDVKERIELIINFLAREIEILEMQDGLKKRVKGQLDKVQKEYYLNEQLKAIQDELKEISSTQQPLSDNDKLKKRIEEVGLSEEAKEKALSELSKLKMMPPMSAEATVIRNYLDYLLDLPWQKKSEVNKDLVAAENILENDHYGLEKVKERIIEHLAVQQRVEKMKGPILCLVGPPGVGKTSLGQSIARATGRQFARISLGGVRDEAEIRGHRRTYIGSMPGKILQKLAKIKVRNPLFMLDEVDKMSADFRGDPASALLEVLDPEQNHTFNDHYLEVDYDLSDVMFIATANSLDIPLPLLDRMEVIMLSGYTENEKMNIARKYLIPKQKKENGLQEKELTITDDAIKSMIRYYTREAGVRNLEREIAKICRKVVKDILVKEKNSDEKSRASAKSSKSVECIIASDSLEKYLGVKMFRFGLAEENDRVGEVNGLAWTEVGGDLLTIEVAVVSGKGKALYTGQLGEVMQESIQAALTVVRSRAKSLGISAHFIDKSDIHVHVPEGATPKDGPSAGIGMCTALVSALTQIPVKADVAMTGEITLRGEVLPIGGLKEKLLAALRGGIKTVIIPEENVKDLKEVQKNITSDLNIVPVRWIDEVLAIALQKTPAGLKKNLKSNLKKDREKYAKTKKTTGKVTRRKKH